MGHFPIVAHSSIPQEWPSEAPLELGKLRILKGIYRDKEELQPWVQVWSWLHSACTLWFQESPGCMASATPGLTQGVPGAKAA
jgi:hypothetical protein